MLNSTGVLSGQEKQTQSDLLRHSEPVRSHPLRRQILHCCFSGRFCRLFWEFMTTSALCVQRGQQPTPGATARPGDRRAQP